MHLGREVQPLLSHLYNAESRIKTNATHLNAIHALARLIAYLCYPISCETYFWTRYYHVYMDYLQCTISWYPSTLGSVLFLLVVPVTPVVLLFVLVIPLVNLLVLDGYPSL